MKQNKENIFDVLHHGGRYGVTGSCHELLIDSNNSLLIDCGTFQGDEVENGRTSRQGNRIDFSIHRIRAVVITHVHIDHCGRLPWLFLAGFDGPVYCCRATALLLPVVLEDGLNFVGRDKEEIRNLLPQIISAVRPLALRKEHKVELAADCRVSIRLGEAGHIFGSVWARIRTMGRHSTSALFSGDLGAPHTPLLPPPDKPKSCDLLVLESTYGDRLHEDRKNRAERLKEILEHCLENKGTVLIPAFSIGRTQELLYEIEGIIHDNLKKKAAPGLDWGDMEIVLDSPLAHRFTNLYKQLKPLWDKEAARRVKTGRHPLSFEGLTIIESHKDHLQTVEYLKNSGRPTIVISASGMCSGGRIVNYLKALIGAPRTDVLFVGYQAAGTPGRDIQKWGPRGGYVEFENKRYDIRAGVHTLGGYSAHADADNLLSFVKALPRVPQEIRLVHGEDEARAALKRQIETEYSRRCTVTD